jgi:hypothetical protein
LPEQAGRRVARRDRRAAVAPAERRFFGREIEPTLGVLRVVAIETAPRQQRPDLVVERPRCPVVSRRLGGRRGKHCAEHQRRGNANC